MYRNRLTLASIDRSADRFWARLADRVSTGRPQSRRLGSIDSADRGGLKLQLLVHFIGRRGHGILPAGVSETATKFVARMCKDDVA